MIDVYKFSAFVLDLISFEVCEVRGSQRPYSSLSLRDQQKQPLVSMSLNEFWCTKEIFKPYSFDRLMQMTESIPGSSEEDDM